MKNRKCMKRVIVAICTIGMLLSPMSAMADDVIPLETEQTIETTEAEVQEKAETKTEEEKTEEEKTEEEKTEDEEETETDEIVETSENQENEDDESETEGEDLDGGKPVVMLKKAVMLLGSGAPDDSIDISKYPDGITIDSSNWQDYDNKTIKGTSSTDKNLVIKDGVTVHLTIDNLVIDRSNGDIYNGRYDAIEIDGRSTLYLTVKGENELKGNDEGGGAGIRVEEGNKLVITAESTGKLTAVGGNGRGGAAGIGSGNCNYAATGGSQGMGTPTLGTIEICGGTIDARGGNSFVSGGVAVASAGIGLSGMGEPGSGSIIISGGDVTATGGKNMGAGIGGGFNSYVGSITISGGKVTANVTSTGNTKSGAAAIGSGFFEGTGSCGAISITGGTVIANGNIGYGENRNSEGFTGGSVEITEGATVTINSGEIISGDNSKVNPNAITKKYTITVTVKNPVYTDGTLLGHVTVGEAYSEDIPFILNAGKATATFDMETTLSGEQTVKVTIDGTQLEDKTIILGTDNDIVYGGNQGFTLSAGSAVTCRYENEVLTISGSGAATISMASGTTITSDRVVVENGSNVTLTLNNITINTTEKGKGAITIGQTDGTASCKLIPVGECNLTREDGIEGGVIEVGDGSSLTIGGSGKLTIRSKATPKKDDSRCYSAGIYAVNGEVVIEDNPNIDIKATGEENEGFADGYMVCIYSKDIKIKGGHINAIASNSGQGIGDPYFRAEQEWYDEKGYVTITGGTIYAEGGYTNSTNGGITSKLTCAVIGGGNVNMNRRANVNPSDFKKPVNSEDKAVYCTTITVGDAHDNGKNTLSINAKVESLKIKAGEDDYTYGTDGMYTDAEGKLYLWLPDESIVSEVKTENGTYSGECITNNEYPKNSLGNPSYRGNIFGAAEATFTIAEGSTFHKFTREVKSDATLKSAGTCTEKAVYYYTCEDCGAISTDKTFEGETNPNNHVNTEIRNGKEAVHKTQKDGYSGDKYCKDCGIKLEEGTVINPTSHIASDWKHSDTEHWKNCTVEGCGVEIPGSRAAHSSTGTHVATCQKKAVCDACGVEYGEKLPCNYTAEIKSEAALKTPATGTEEAVYYYSCSMCGAVEGNDEHTFVDHHEPENDPEPSNHEPSDPAPSDPTSIDPAPVNPAPSGPATVTPVLATILPAKAQTTEVIGQNSNDNHTIGDTVEHSDDEQSQNVDEQNAETPIDETKTQGNTKSKGNSAGETDSTINDAAATDTVISDTDDAQKKVAMRQVAIVTSAIAGTGAVGGGAYFVFKRKRLLEKILKNLFKK